MALGNLYTTPWVALLGYWEALRRCFRSEIKMLGLLDMAAFFLCYPGLKDALGFGVVAKMGLLVKLDFIP